MDKLIDLLKAVLANKHTSSAAITLFVLGVAGVLWPSQKDKFDEISKLAMFYGLLSAGDAGKGGQPVIPPSQPTTKE